MTSEQIALELRHNLEKRFPNFVKKVILYGSQARGDANKHSDIDILVILSCKVNWQITDQIYEECFELNLKYDVWIDISVLSEEDMNSIRGIQPFVQNALTEGISV